MIAMKIRANERQRLIYGAAVATRGTRVQFNVEIRDRLFPRARRGNIDG